MQYSALKSTVVLYNSWYTGVGIEWPGKNSYWLEEGDGLGDGTAEESSAIGHRGQAAISLMPDIDDTGFASLLDSILSTLLRKWSSHVWAVLFFSHHRWYAHTALHSEQLLQLPCTVLCLGPVPQKPVVPPQIKKIPSLFTSSWISPVLWLFLLVSFQPFSGPPIPSGLHY